MPFDGFVRPRNVHTYRAGGVVTWRPGNNDVGEGIGVAVFLTRWGRFTDASLEPGWVLVDRTRMVGPWFDGDEVYLVLVARNLDLDPPPVEPQLSVVTQYADAEGIPLDAPFASPRGWATETATVTPTIQSVALIGDMLTGERTEVGQVAWLDMPGGWQNTTSLHIARRDAAAMLNYGETTGTGTEWPLDPIRYKKVERLSGDPESVSPWGKLYLRTRSSIKWADGTTEERIRVGADTVIQRIAVQFSTALPAPTKPEIVGGSPQWVDPAATATIGLTYVSTLAGDLTKLVWKRTDASSAVTYWNQTTQLWQVGAFENFRSTPSQTFPVGAFAADTTYTLQVAAKGTTGDLSPYSDGVLVDTHPIPTATIGLTPYDAGTEVTTSLSPTVTVGGEAADGQTLTGYRVEVLNPEGQRWAYAEVSGLADWTVAPALPNNTTGWTVRLRTVQSGGAMSGWVSLPFDVAAVVPGAPDVTAEQITHPVSGLPIVRLTVDLPWETDGFDYEHNAITLYVERSVDAGTTWMPIGQATPVPGWASGITLDDEAPNHLPAQYRVRADATTVYGGSLVGPWGASIAVSTYSVGMWLSPLGFPELAVQVALTNADEGKISSGMSGTPILGASHQVVTGVAAVLAEGGYVARTDTPEDEAALVSLLAGGHLLTLSMRPERDLSDTPHLVPRRWFRVVGDIGVARIAQGPWSVRLVSWNAVPQPAPATIGG